MSKASELPSGPAVIRLLFLWSAFFNSRLRSRDWNWSAYELLSEKFSNTPPTLPAPVGCPSPQGRLLVHHHQWSCCVWISACKASPAHFHVPVSPSAFPETKQPGVLKCTDSSTSKFRWSNLFFLFLHVAGEAADLFWCVGLRFLAWKLIYTFEINQSVFGQ